MFCQNNNKAHVTPCRWIVFVSNFYRTNFSNTQIIIANTSRRNSSMYVNNASVFVKDIKFFYRKVSQQDGAPAHMAQGCSEFPGEDEWPSNPPNVNPLHYHVWEVMPIAHAQETCIAYRKSAQETFTTNIADNNAKADNAAAVLSMPVYTAFPSAIS